jgi:hypothetical protein
MTTVDASDMLMGKQPEDVLVDPVRVNPWKADAQRRAGKTMSATPPQPRDAVWHDLQDEAADALRDVEAKYVPEIAPVNREYTLGKALEPKVIAARDKPTFSYPLGIADMITASTAWGYGGPFKSAEAIAALAALKLGGMTQGGRRVIGAGLHKAGTGRLTRPTINASTWSLLRPRNTQEQNEFQLELEE